MSTFLLAPLGTSSSLGPPHPAQLTLTALPRDRHLHRLLPTARTKDRMEVGEKVSPARLLQIKPGPPPTGGRQHLGVGTLGATPTPSFGRSGALVSFFRPTLFAFHLSRILPQFLVLRRHPPQFSCTGMRQGAGGRGWGGCSFVFNWKGPSSS